MLNASCAANVNEVCAISSSSNSSNILMTSMNQNFDSVILDLKEASSYCIEFNATSEDIKITLKVNYSNCKCFFVILLYALTTWSLLFSLIHRVCIIYYFYFALIKGSIHDIKLKRKKDITAFDL